MSEPETFTVRIGGDEFKLSEDSTFEEFDEAYERIETEMAKIVRAAPIEWAIGRAMSQGEDLGIAPETTAALIARQDEIREDE